MCLSGCSVTVPLLTFAKELSRVSCFPLDRSGCSQECVTPWALAGTGLWAQLGHLPAVAQSVQQWVEDLLGWSCGASSRAGEGSPLRSTLPTSIPRAVPILSPTAPTSLLIPFPVTVHLEFTPENQSSDQVQQTGGSPLSGPSQVSHLSLPSVDISDGVGHHCRGSDEGWITMGGLVRPWRGGVCSE